MWDLDKTFTEICKGDENARHFCHSFYGWLHMVDDLFDRDKEVTPAAWAEINLNILDQCHNNPFFRDNFPSLWPVIRSSFMAWVDSTRWEVGDTKEKICSQVFKSQYQDVFFEVAYLVGGVRHQRLCSKHFRDYDFD